MPIKPKPTALKVLQGNPGKRAINKREPQPGALGPPPVDLCEVARAKWAELTRLECWGLVTTQADAELLAEYCRLHARKANAEGKVAEFGELVKGANGFPVQSPWVSAADRCWAGMFKIALEFGGSPSSRTRLSTGPAKSSSSKWDGLIA